MMMKFRYFYQLYLHLGLNWLVFRVIYAVKLRAGYFRRQLPARSWDSYPLSQWLSDPAFAASDRYKTYRQDLAPDFFFDIKDRANYQLRLLAWDAITNQKYPDRLSPIKLAQKIEDGVYSYFSHTMVKGEFPQHWQTNPFTNITAPTDRYWTEIGDFGSGDIKVIWEPNRFAFTYTLVRAYWRTGENKYAEIFWQLVEDWCDRNPPLAGVNWKCGQEISFRVMAWCFGLYGFLDAPATTAERIGKLAQAIALSGARIALNLDYALSQRNNHGMSEALGLWTIGVLFPEFKSATKWEQIGRKELEKQGRELVYDDGSFSQNSINYHRVMLHDYLWVIRLGDILDRSFSSELKQRIAKAGEFLYQLQDLTTGHLPCYGANDGALVLPLSNCDYRDFRPVVQSIYYLDRGKRCFASDIYDEDLLWLFGIESLTSHVDVPGQIDLATNDGGYYTMRREDSFILTRCAQFRDRPSDADLLHVDLWWKGQNIAIDAGTYSYNALPPWDRGLDSTEYHNTVTVDRLDQMDRFSKFLWLPWARGRTLVRQSDSNGQLAYWEGSHDGYHRLPVPVNHNRGILNLDDESWLVIDRLTSTSSHEYQLNWLFLDCPYQWDRSSQSLTLNTCNGDYFISVGTSSPISAATLVRADLNSPRGWHAPYYYAQHPALSLNFKIAAESTFIWTVFSPKEVQTSCHGTNLLITIDLVDRLVPLEKNLDLSICPI